MSRTIKGSKPANSDPWSKRPFNNKGLGSWGSYARKRIAKAERQQGIKEVRDTLKQ